MIYTFKIDVQCLFQVFPGGGDEIKLIQYRKVTKLNAKIPSLFSCQEGGRNFVTGYRLSSQLSVHQKVLII
jgi:hypothetical protein